ncbi:MAG: hypothetical protein COX90_03955 [Candidatus Nealsonbacteria bacterium CG_4_10_14_0_2_um_filter_38_17]|uniref:DUF192 domain-containing protein n=2 Tax=Candidatus Nealsoniibacteriota TaxID=1817911 RepID=A0A2M7UX40_9BACT|nr:MAG: hypothetical protein COX36_01615 [Candidatus Nealsonbacteria bacterium CG23_combo_of_CG06-09_8_20_14_all_38_19]PIZ88536.1 MAG: hypothetical protein COX90_03955 [Candidatus Nealsonbacteria bacterium CG_4_10_14_0_2_um_filter_38_17]
MKRVRIFLVAGVIITSFVIITASKWQDDKNAKICLRGECYYVELAVTPEERQKGLMFRNKLDKDRGMFFIFPEEELYSFWMKNTLISLDIIWINKDEKVVFISENTSPCMNEFCPSIIPDKKAKYVLEIKGGVAGQLGLTIGDKAVINY